MSGALIEMDPTNVAIARGRIAHLDLALTAVEADAGTTDTYPGLVPADLLLLSGIMGNISAPDIERLVRVSRQFCAAGATSPSAVPVDDPTTGRPEAGGERWQHSPHSHQSTWQPTDRRPGPCRARNHQCRRRARMRHPHR